MDKLDKFDKQVKNQAENKKDTKKKEKDNNIDYDSIGSLF